MTDVLEFRVYISSTIDDLTEERKAAMEIIRRYAVVKDSYRASEDGVVDTCTEDVRECHLYVGIIGHRYGWVVPPGAEEPDAKSITELEYDACRSPGHANIKRLIFVRTNSDDKFRDSENRPVTKDRIAHFRDRVRAEQQAFEFSNLADFRVALSDAIQTKRNEFHRENRPGRGIFDPRRDWQGGLRPVCLVGVPGVPAGEAVHEQLSRAREQFFVGREISPDDDSYLASIDRAIQTAQLTCLCITPVALQRLSQVAKKVERAIGLMRKRLGQSVVLLAGVNPSLLPQEWKAGDVELIDLQKCTSNPADAADLLYRKLQMRLPLTTETRLALPWFAVAPTEDEVKELIDPAGAIFDEIDDEDLREQRKKQRDLLVQAIRAHAKSWPEDMYGRERGDWRCFGAGSPAVRELIGSVVSEINHAPRGSRERQTLQEAMLIPRSYDLNELLVDEMGSRSAVEAIRDKGCLVVVDELALLHPRLRRVAEILLASPMVAAVSVNPCDPTHLSTSRLLGEASFLRVGNLVNRFKTLYDPQCELALNNEDRVRRWLRQAIPRLVSEADVVLGRPILADRTDKLFAETAP